jgi:hypothetical protein
MRSNRAKTLPADSGGSRRTSESARPLSPYAVTSSRTHCKNVTKPLSPEGTPIAGFAVGYLSVNITFTSTLTSEDENRIAPALLKVVASILDLMPVAYRIRIDTVDAHVYQYCGPRDTKSESASPEPLRLVPRDPAS